MSGKVKEVAVEEAERIKTLTTDAVRSGAYLYPLRVSREKCQILLSFLLHFSVNEKLLRRTVRRLAF